MEFQTTDLCDANEGKVRALAVTTAKRIPAEPDVPTVIEAGVPVVQAAMGGVQTWDTHVANFPRLRDSLLPPLDQAVAEDHPVLDQLADLDLVLAVRSHPSLRWRDT